MRERLYGLDALRGLAAIVVVLFHLGLPIVGAHLAVDFFFMLSGFVMARTYEQRLRSGELGGLRFLFSRYRRLWGWMAAGSTLGLLAMAGTAGFSGDILLAYGFALLLVPALNLPAFPYLLNQPLWSIFYELIANAAHGLGLARVNAAGLALIAASCAVGLAVTISLSGFPRGGFVEFHWLVLLRVGLGYTLGILIYRLFGDVAPLRVPFPVAVGILPLYVLAIYLWPVAWGPLAFIVILAPLMMFGGMNVRFASDSGTRSAATLGAVSFPLYAVHVPVIMLLQRDWGPILCMMIALGGWLYWRVRAARRGEDPAGRRRAAI